MGYPTEVLANIYSLVNAVTNIGKVYDKRRVIPDESSMESAYTSTISSNNVIRAWFIYRGGVQIIRGPSSSISPQVGSRRRQWRHEIVVEGFFGYSDSLESEDAMNAVVDDVLTTLSTNITLTGDVLTTTPPIAQMAWDDFLIEGIFGHHIRITFEVIEDEAYAPV